MQKSTSVALCRAFAGFASLAFALSSSAASPPFFDTLLEKVQSVKTEYQDLPNSTWTTVANITGQGVVRRIFIATNDWGSTSSASDRNSIYVRITANGAATPQIGGTAGVTMQDVSGAGLDQDLLIYRNNEWGITTNDNTIGLSFYLNTPMPFDNGYKVEMMSARTGSCPGSCAKCWTIVEYQSTSASVSDGWVLNYQSSRTTGVAKFSRIDLLNVQGKAVLLARLHHIVKNGPANWYPLEGNYQIKYDGSSTVSYEASGTEDFYGSSGYFREGPFIIDEAGLVTLDSSTHNFHAYRNFRRNNQMPYGSTGLELSWQNGEAVHDPGGTVESFARCWYYTK